MAMKSALYNEIVRTIKAHKGLAKDCLSVLKGKYSEVSGDTLFSILSLEHQKRMRALHNKSESTKKLYWTLYNTAIKSRDSPGIIVRIATIYQISPCLVAKLILRKYFEEEGFNEKGFRSNTNINFYMRNTSLIPDMDMAYEVYLCTVYDILYSPIAETMKHSLGQQYEIKLINQVKDMGLAFRDEEQLRRIGYDKTPDIKLEVPIAIDGFIVNWIESKALFGEEFVHKDYMKHQYLSYWNRFGSGLIIYWFGYLDKIVDPNDKCFMISDCLPNTNVTFLIPPKSG